MDVLNNGALGQNRTTLQSSLFSLRGQVSNGQLIDVLAEMNAAGALVLRKDVGGVREPFWVATGDADHAFADRIFDLVDDQHALLAELFWWQTDAPCEGESRKPS
jgi:hypothetical protein